jgi:tRNA G18 (ribose-2'-O)-methylase SpoU
MVTDRYQHVLHHPDVTELVAWAEGEGLPLLGIDNLPEAQPIETADLPRAAVMVFGQEGPGLTAEALAACTAHYAIAQYGSTRSINAGAAAAIAMHAWVRQHSGLDAPDIL